MTAWLVVAAVAAVAVGGGPAEAAGATVPWSTPRAIPGCAGEGPVAIAFPASSPFVASGPGAIVLAGGADCRAAAARRAAVSAVGAQDLPGPALPLIPAGVGALTTPAAVAGASDGDVVVAGAVAGPKGSTGAVTEGRAGASPPRAYPLGGPPGPVAATSAYLGDVAVVSLGGSGRSRLLSMRLQRHYVRAPGPARTVAARTGAVTALAVGLDYRSDALVAWASAGSLFARWVQAGGRLGAVQRLAGVGSAPRVSVTISDDNRAIIAWIDQPAGGGTASVYTDISEPRVRFRRAALVERFAEPAGRMLPPGSLRLTRLARESVLLAWTGVDSGHYAVRAAPVRLAGVGRSATVSAPGEDSVLADLVAGPRNEALAIWSAVPMTGAGGAATGATGSGPAIMAARGLPGGAFGAAEEIAGPGPNGAPAVAIDPATDRALAAWPVAGPRPEVDYAVREPG